MYNFYCYEAIIEIFTWTDISTRITKIMYNFDCYEAIIEIFTWTVVLAARITKTTYNFDCYEAIIEIFTWTVILACITKTEALWLWSTYYYSPSIQGIFQTL